MQDCDTLLDGWIELPVLRFLPEEGKARGVQIDMTAG